MNTKMVMYRHEHCFVEKTSRNFSRLHKTISLKKINEFQQHCFFSWKLWEFLVPYRLDTLSISLILWNLVDISGMVFDPLSDENDMQQRCLLSDLSKQRSSELNEFSSVAVMIIQAHTKPSKQMVGYLIDILNSKDRRRGDIGLRYNYFTIASTNPIKSGCGVVGREMSSGWAWVAIIYGWSRS